MSLSKKEEKTLKETRLRNLKRKYARLINHPDCIEECIDLKSEIDQLEMEIAMMQM